MMTILFFCKQIKFLMSKILSIIGWKKNAGKKNRRKKKKQIRLVPNRQNCHPCWLLVLYRDGKSTCFMSFLPNEKRKAGF